jgi:hypothetical protein
MCHIIVGSHSEAFLISRPLPGKITEVCGWAYQTIMWQIDVTRPFVLSLLKQQSTGNRPRLGQHSYEVLRPLTRINSEGLSVVLAWELVWGVALRDVYP